MNASPHANPRRVAIRALAALAAGLAFAATAMESAASASLRMTLMPSQPSCDACRTATAQAVMAATVIGGTFPAKNGASPKFSTTIASYPFPARIAASCAARFAHSEIDSDDRGLPGSGGR